MVTTPASKFDLDSVIGLDSDVDIGSDSDSIEVLNVEWPGVEYRMGTDQFKALLGTPHGKAVSWLAVNRPNKTLDKNIEAVLCSFLKSRRVILNKSSYMPSTVDALPELSGRRVKERKEQLSHARLLEKLLA